MIRRAPRPTVVLFDVDGTLVTTEGAGRRAMERAFEQGYGRRNVLEGIRLGGRTDRAIVRMGLRSIGADDRDEAIEALLSAYLVLLAEEMAATNGCRAFQGVMEAVDASFACEGVATGLGTGNVKAGALLKLAPVGLAERFPFGGFGCDHEDRDILLRTGAERGAARLAAPLSECRVVIVGDTPKDVAAAKAIGAECIAVATGTFRVDDLQAAGADLVVRDLSERGAIETILGVC